MDPDLSIDCGPKCINKLISTECDIWTCPCATSCQNMRFQTHCDSCVYPIPTGGKGWGLAAGEDITRGKHIFKFIIPINKDYLLIFHFIDLTFIDSFIIQYIGEVFSVHSEHGRAKLAEYGKSTCTYLMR